MMFTVGYRSGGSIMHTPRGHYNALIVRKFPVTPAKVVIVPSWATGLPAISQISRNGCAWILRSRPAAH